MKSPKSFVIEMTDGICTKTTTHYLLPVATVMREAKERIIALSGSGVAVSVRVIENISSKYFETDGHGKIKVRNN